MLPSGNPDRGEAAAHLHPEAEAAVRPGPEAVARREDPADGHPKAASVGALPCGAVGHREAGRRADPGAWGGPPKADVHPEAEPEVQGDGLEGLEAQGSHSAHPWAGREVEHRERGAGERPEADPGGGHRAAHPEAAPCQEAGAADHREEAAAGTRAAHPAAAPNRRGRAPEPGTCADARTASSPR